MAITSSNDRLTKILRLKQRQALFVRELGIFEECFCVYFARKIVVLIHCVLILVLIKVAGLESTFLCNIINIFMSLLEMNRR